MAWYNDNITQDFFWNPTHTHNHSGIDLGTGIGQPITAPFDGVVDHSKQAWGGQINEHLIDAAGNHEVLTFMHTSQELVSGPVHAGELLGYSGTPPLTGPNAFKYGNGPHIHFERTMGDKAPYIGYNPWYPTSNNFPVTPKPILNQLIHGGEGGTMLGAPGGITANFPNASSSSTTGLSTDISGLSGSTGLPSLITITPDFTGIGSGLLRVLFGILGGVIILVSLNNFVGAFGIPNATDAVKAMIASAKEKEQAVESAAKVAAVAA